MINVMTQPIKTSISPASLRFRPGTLADSYDVYKITERALADLSQRIGVARPGDAPDSDALVRAWPNHRSLYHHLAGAAEKFWIAERNGRPIGFTRSMMHEGVWELTEFFILPGEQSTGVGRELLRRVWPAQPTRRRCIIATIDSRAQARYLKAGLYPRFPIYYFGRTPEKTTMATDLTIEPVTASAETLAAMGELDQAILGYRRDMHHRWFCSDRQGYLYYRDNQPVGYGYVGRWNGPFVLLDNQDFPAVLAHAESAAAAQGQAEFGMDIPMVNRAAIDYLLARNYRMGKFIVYLMSDEPFGKFENYINTSPMFFL